MGTWGLGDLGKADKAGNLETKRAVKGGLSNFNLGTIHRARAVRKVGYLGDLGT